MKKVVVITVVLLLLTVGTLSVSSSTPYPQQEATYVGSETCKLCHSDIYNSWKETLHAWKLRPKEEANIVGQFPVTDVNGVTWTLDDVDYVIGAKPKWKQRYIKVIDGVWRILPIQWNIATGEWVPYHAEDWADGTPERDYKISCVGCHTTGFDIENPDANEGLGFKDFGVACEACHGPGSLHVAGGGDPTKIVKTVSSETCARCHVRGKTKEELYPVRYGWPEGFYPGSGVKLEDVYVLDWGNKAWWFDFPEGETTVDQSGHAKKHRQQYMEWQKGGHAQALDDLKARPYAQDFCLQCHSEDYRRDPENVTLETAQYAVECVTCHATHDTGVEGTSQLKLSAFETCAQCHNSALAEGEQAFEPGEKTHHPMREVFEGRGMIGVDPMPARHFTAEGGPVCSSCHFPPTAKSGVWTKVDDRVIAGDISSHIQTEGLVVAMPGEVAEGEPDSCSQCHSDMTKEALQNIIDTRQSTVKDRIAALENRLNALGAAKELDAWKTAFTNVDIAKEEGSYGIHNFQYISAGLDVAEAELDKISTVFMPVVLNQFEQP